MMTVGFVVAARPTFDSVTSPTPLCRILTVTSSVRICASALSIASTVPFASAFRITLNTFASPFAKSWESSSIELGPTGCSPASRSAARCSSASARASRSLSTARNSSLASGTSDSPITRTGVDGPASFSRLP